VRPLWALHRTHHTDIDVDVTSTLRHHPLDVIVLNLVLAAGVAVFGIGASSVAVFAAMTPIVGIFAHARVRLPEGLERRLALVVQTPGLHRVHHSPNHPETDSNFGLGMTLWDRAFGTFNPPRPAGVVGLDTTDLATRQSVRAMLAEPWRPLVRASQAPAPADEHARPGQAG
jgi:sterol desaturase/sphingolipid hydroxylase (fatty acid hydroxylase superfamily)